MIKDKLLRYAIPFHFTNYQSIRDTNFEVQEKNGEKKSNWKRKSIISGENDLYDYIVNLMKEDDGRAVGASWEWKDKNTLSKPTYCTKVENETIDWRLVKLGTVLFDMGVGFLWYEIEIKTELCDVETLHEFSYILKELSRGEKQETFLRFSCKEETLEKTVEQMRNDAAISIEEELETKDGLIIKGKKHISFFENVLSPFLDGICIDSYFANRKNSAGVLLPDRSIPFIWVLNNPEILEEQKVFSTVFRLGRCYNKQYSMPQKTNEANFYRPFEDSIWCTSLEGCANFVFPKEKKEFYSGGYKSRLDTYFYLFILNLGQYYSLLQLGTEVAELPTDDKKYSLRNTILEDMLDKIHVFNLKNMYSQVGHFTQHNEFNSYLRRRFSVNEMHYELEAELKILRDMIERKKEEKKARRTRILTIISGVFVFAEVVASVNQVVETYYGEPVISLWIRGGISVAIVFAIAVIGCIFWLLFSRVDRALDKKEKKKYVKN